MLQDLVRYYEILAENEDSGVPKSGYGTVNVSYSLNIDDSGNLINLTSCKVQNGKKLVPRPMLVPEPVKGRTGTKVVPDFLFGNSSYVLGFDNKEKKIKNEKEIDRAKECFQAFKNFNIELLGKADCAEAKAVIQFLDKWDPESALENPHIKEYLDDIYKGAIFIFRYYGKVDVHKVQSIRKVWESYKNARSDSVIQQCLVTGEDAPIVTLHPVIKGLYGGQSMGNSLVSFNAEAYESYSSGRSKRQGLNAPTGEYAAFAYGTVLNALTADSSHKLILGDTTVVFWAESAVKEYQDMFSLLMDCSELEDNANKKWVRSESAERMVKNVLDNIAEGKPSDLDAFYNSSIDHNIRFYILGMSPNAARISVRFYLRDNFGSFVKRISRHYRDLSIQKQYDTDMRAIPVWKILNETISKNSENKSAPTYLSTTLMRAILLGEDYPSSLYQTILIRIRAEQDINYYKASIIKACLLRKTRRSNKKLEEVLTLALNEESKNKAYVLGRLFAALEKVQRDANPEIKSTIRDKYFSSASTTPASTFPTLLNLAQHHISKSDYGILADKKIAEIMSLLDVDDNPFPKNLSLDEQGLFFLGFYHQRNAFYKK